MASSTDLMFENPPAAYRQVYDILCPARETMQMDRDMFIKLFASACNLPSQTLSSIWELVDNKQDYLTRYTLYKTLAFIAAAQQGKQVNEKLLETFSELPKPYLGDLNDLKMSCIKLRREKTPTSLGMNYQEICAIDTVNVEIMPEKKGLFLKHVEYEVTSQRQKTKVCRRYNDFVALHELLLLRFPYRSIPRLPPKKMMGADAEFIEDRRRALKRYLTLVCRHPVISDDRLVTFFLSFVGQDAQTKMRETFRNIPDEYVVSDLALQAKDLIPLDTSVQFANSRDQIRQLYTSVNQIKEIVDRIVQRSQAHSQDMMDFGRELSTLAVEKAEATWASEGSDNWFFMKKLFRSLQKNFTILSETLSEQATKEQDEVTEDLYLLVDLLVAYKDLCERHEKGIQQDHQRALSKMLLIKKKIALNSVKGPDPFLTDQLENRIVKHESQILNMENRNYFSLHCIHMETQLIHTSMEVLCQVLHTLVNLQTTGHNNVNKSLT